MVGGSLIVSKEEGTSWRASCGETGNEELFIVHFIIISVITPPSRGVDTLRTFPHSYILLLLFLLVFSSPSFLWLWEGDLKRQTQDEVCFLGLHGNVVHQHHVVPR